MPDETPKFPAEPAEGSRSVIEKELARTPEDENQRESGARKLEPAKGRRPNPVHTGDRGDEPKKPYGLTEPSNDRGSGTRHYDGRDMTSGKTGDR